MKTKNLLVLSLTALLGCVSLTSCGSGGADIYHEVDQYLPEDNPTSQVEINFWHCLGHAKQDNLQIVVNKFNADYAGIYHVNPIPLAGDYNSLSSDVQTKLRSGEVPAITMGYPDSFSEYMTDELHQSAILRLDNFIKDKTFGYKYTADPQTGAITAVEDFVPGFFNEGIGYQFNGVWSMPLYKSTEALFYNKSYFCGVNDPNIVIYTIKPGDSDEVRNVKTQYNTLRTIAENLTNKKKINENLKNLKDFIVANKDIVPGITYEVPEHWSELLTLAETMRLDRQRNGITSDFIPLGYDSDSNMMISQLAQRGYKYTTKNIIGGDRTTHFQFNNNDTISLLTEIKLHVDAGDMTTKNKLGGTFTSNLFTEGKCAMSIGSTGGSSYQTSTNFAVGVEAIPYSGNTPKYIQQGPSICFFDNDNNGYIHKGAWLFYKYLADPENNAKLALDNSYDPIRVTSFSTDYYNNHIAKAGQNLGLNYDVPALTKTITQYYMTTDVFRGSATARNEIGNILTYMFRNGLEIDKALGKAYTACCAVVQ